MSQRKLFPEAPPRRSSTLPSDAPDGPLAGRTSVLIAFCEAIKVHLSEPPSALLLQVSGIFRSPTRVSLPAQSPGGSATCLRRRWSA